MTITSAKLTKPGIRKVAEAVAKGVPVGSTAFLVGVSSETLKRWVAHGKVMTTHMETAGEFPAGSQKHDWLCYDLVKAIQEAKGKAIIRYVKKINAAAAHSWIPASWLLQRLVPEEFGNRQSVVETEVKGKDESDVKLKVSVYLPDNGRDPA